MGLPAELRLRRSPDISAAVRRGRRVRSGGLVVHGLTRSDPAGLASGRGPAGPAGATGAPAGPRVAFVAPRTCGPAVRRNRTRRRVQEEVRGLVGAGRLPADVDLVVRLLPEATAAGSDELAGWLVGALRRLGALAPGSA